MAEALRWWLAAVALSAVALPLCLTLFRALPDRGLAFNKAFGLLAVSYVFWLLNSLGVLPNTLAGVLIASGVVLAISIALVIPGWHEMARWLRAAWTYAVAVEALWLIVFALVAWYRSASGQIVFGEKPMEFMLLNATLYADRFPPQDAWLSGHDVAYYYFGYLMVSVLGRLAAVPTEVAFNIAFAGFIASAATGAAGLLYNLRVFARSDRGLAHTAPRITDAPLRDGLLAGVLLLLLGNLVAVFVFLSSYGIGGDGFYEWLDIRDLTAGITRHAWYPAQPYIFGATGGTIRIGDALHAVTSNPAASIYLGDLHPHVMALPFVLLALTAGLALMTGQPAKAGPHYARLSAFGVVLGATGFLSFWDFPWPLLIAAGALTMDRRERTWADVAVDAAVLAGVAILAYAPFYLQLDRRSEGVYPVVESALVTHPGSRPLGLLLHWAPLAVLVLPFVLWKLPRPPGGARARDVAVAGAAPAAIIAGWPFLFLLHRAAGSARVADAPGMLEQVQARGIAWVAAVVLALAVALTVLALLAVLRQARTPRRDADALVLAMVAVAAALLLTAEFYWLGDVAESRIVTLFKLSFAAWTLLAIAAAYAVASMLGGAGRAGRISLAVAAPVCAAAMLLPLGMVPNRVWPSFPDGTSAAEPRGLNGMRSYSDGERAGIAWLRERAKGQPYVIAESVVTGNGASDYAPTARFSMASGMPAVLGWPSHEAQWRGGGEALGTRREDIARLYQSADMDGAQDVIERYGIDFIIVGPVERAAYAGASLDKFAALPVAFEHEDVTIYDAR